MIDTLETARLAGLALSPQLPQSPGAVFDFHQMKPTWIRLIEARLALTFAVNSINRSIGLHDLYPFVLPHRWWQNLPSCKSGFGPFPDGQPAAKRGSPLSRRAKNKTRLEF
jgi:hypothetical protein